MMGRATMKAEEHVIFGDKGLFRCTHCGASFQPFQGGNTLEIWAYTALMKGFAKEHRDCPAPEVPRCRFCHSPDHTWEDHIAKTTTCPEQWPLCGDTGISSRAIYAHMMGLPQDGTWGAGEPSDPSDFGRCYRLLHAPWAQGWRSRIGEMAKYPRWAGLAAAWDELEALYVEELAKGDEAPKLYKRMTELRER